MNLWLLLTSQIYITSPNKIVWFYGAPIWTLPEFSQIDVKVIYAFNNNTCKTKDFWHLEQEITLFSQANW